MNTRRSLVGLASLVLIVTAGLPAWSSAKGGPCAPSTPQYCPPPAVKTGPAKHVTSTSATLTGTVNPNGSATTCYFEYGLTNKYGSTTPPQNEGSGTKPKQVSATVTGLTPQTVYHYQLVCSNLGGRATGGDRKFKTHSAPRKPGPVRTGKAKHVTSTSATLTGTANPNGSPTKCWFEYGRTQAYHSTTTPQSIGSSDKARSVSATVTGLMPKTVYHYQLVCRNAGGLRTGGDRRFETSNQIRIRGSRTILVDSKGTFTVLLHCNGNHSCVGTLTLTGRGGTALAQPVHYVIRPHTTGQVQMTLSSAALQSIKKRHHLAGRLRARDLDGSSASRRVHLRTRHGKHTKHGPLSTR